MTSDDIRRLQAAHGRGEALSRADIDALLTYAHDAHSATYHAWKELPREFEHVVEAWEPADAPKDWHPNDEPGWLPDAIRDLVHALTTARGKP